MTIDRHVLNPVLVCISASLFALQLGAGTPQAQANKVAVVAVHQATVRHISHQRLDSKRLVASLPIHLACLPRPRAVGDVALLRAPESLVRLAATYPARAPLLS